MTGPDVSWRDRAACRGTDPTPFFAFGPASQEALDRCDACPVRTDCLEYAVADPDIVGMWAGTYTRDRMRIRAARGATPAGHGTTSCYSRGCRCRDCRDAWSAYHRERRRLACVERGPDQCPDCGEWFGDPKTYGGHRRWCAARKETA